MSKTLGLTAISLALLACAGSAAAEEYVVQIATPGEGPLALIGKSMRNGITLALEEAEDGGRFRDGVHLSLRNIDDNIPDEQLPNRIQKEVFSTDALLVIGPLLSNRAESVALAANRFKFPLLSPGVSDRVTMTGPWVFRSGAAPYKLIQSMSRDAIIATRSRKIAIIKAADNSGFESQARAVASVASQLKQMITAEIELADSEEGYAEASANLRSVDSDLIFVMMDAEPAGVLAAQLRKDGLSEKSRLVFGPATSTPALLQVGREYVENSLVATDYLPEIPGDQNQHFVSKYRERYGVTADRWAGIGYATGLIAAEAIRNAGPAPNRDLVRDALERVQKIAVPLGKQAWTMNSQHEPDYEPALLQIKNRQFVPYTTN